MSADPPPASTGVTRRAVLGGAAGLATVAFPSGPSTATVGSHADASTTVQSTAAPTVLTQNAYLGVDLFRLFRAESAAEFRRIAGDLLAEVDPGLYAARADAIAGAVAATGADVVALQEAALLRTQRPGDFGSDDPDPASSVLVDFLSLVESALADRDLDYEVAAVTTTTDVELPAEAEDGRVDVRLTDRDVLLVRGAHAVDERVTATYETSLPIPLPETDRVVSLERGYCSAEVTVDGVAFTAVSTHLESVSPVARRRQARELLDALPDGRPVVVGGDFNSGPGTETDAYDRLTTELADAHAVLASDDGYTCCQAGSLRNDRSRLDRRIDALLYRGPVRPTAVGRVGHRPEDRIEADVDGGTVRVWPSDHAGVVGTFAVAATTPTPTATRTATATATPRPTTSPTATVARSPTPSPDPPTPTPTEGTPLSTSDGSGPGMGVLAAVAGLAAALAARVRHE